MRLIVILVGVLIILIDNLTAFSIKLGTGISVPDLFLKKYYTSVLNFNTSIYFNTSIKKINITTGYTYNKFSDSNTYLTLNKLRIGLKVGEILNFPVKPYIEMGTGAVFMKLGINGSFYTNYDPIFYSGVGFSLLQKEYIYVECLYYLIFQKSQLDAETNAGVIDINLGVLLYI